MVTHMNRRSRRSLTCSARVAATTQPNTQRGVMLLEALVAVLVFSLGILGVVALQAQSIRHVGDAQYRGEAIFLANALVSRMWTDDRSATDPAYLLATYSDRYNGPGYADFREMVARLPGAEQTQNAPQVTIAAGPTPLSSVVTVTVFWQPPGDPTVHNYSTNAVIGRNP